MHVGVKSPRKFALAGAVERGKRSRASNTFNSHLFLFESVLVNRVNAFLWNWKITVETVLYSSLSVLMLYCLLIKLARWTAPLSTQLCPVIRSGRVTERHYHRQAIPYFIVVLSHINTYCSSMLSRRKVKFISNIKSVGMHASQRWGVVIGGDSDRLDVFVRKRKRDSELEETLSVFSRFASDWIDSHLCKGRIHAHLSNVLASYQIPFCTWCTQLNVFFVGSSRSIVEYFVSQLQNSDGTIADHISSVRQLAYTCM